MAQNLLPRPVKKVRVDTSLSIVNIVLLLILFFLATGQLMNAPSHGVDLSRTTDLEIKNLPAPVLVVGPGGTVAVDGEPVTPQELAAALEGQDKVFVLIARDAPAVELLDVLARPELAAAEVQLVTVHESGEGG